VVLNVDDLSEFLVEVLRRTVVSILAVVTIKVSDCSVLVVVVIDVVVVAVVIVYVTHDFTEEPSSQLPARILVFTPSTIVSKRSKGMGRQPVAF
jgi:hypothetical protein